MAVKKSTKKIIIAVIVFAALVLAFLTVYLLTKPKTTVGAKTIAIAVVDLDGNMTQHSISTDTEYLADAMKEAGLIDGVESEFGLMVTAVDGIVADDSLQQWWMLTVGGEFSEYGASDLPITDGGHYEWTLTEGWDW